MSTQPLPEAVCVHCGQRFNAAHCIYTVRPASLSADVSAAFVQLQRDDAATGFLLQCAGRTSSARYAQSVAASALRTTLSLTDANGIIGRGGMHCLSEGQALQLLRPGEPQCERGTLLDVGAGDGSVTAHLAPLFQRVFATEVSAPMLRRLRSRPGFGVLDSADVSREALDAAAQVTDVGPLPADGFDCVALLNVLDRCDAPRTLLLRLRQLMKPVDGRLLLAVVLPFRPFVEEGTQRRPPRESLGLSSTASFEASLDALWRTVLQPLGFRLHAVSRVPYMSDGDEKSPVYVLDDAILVLSMSPAERG
jgi:SAM-dependent methyltransferase